uniref:Ribosomal RNA processing 12 homolog n=1 Tax=Callorhinchus milii TaxID=7868 RepID=A0A4W3IP71_CALMI
MVKAGRLRAGVNRKLKRWRKGHSSDSNPETSRFREAARSRFFRHSDLTVSALKLHNELQPCPGEEGALTEQTGGTFLSGLSDCSNLTFSRVQRLWESNSAAHKEVCAVLAAVTDVIRAEGGNETETEYFAALMTTMGAVETEESIAAVAYLLNLVMKRVPAPVLIRKFSETAQVFINVLGSEMGSGSTAAVRWVLSCLASLLRRQDLTVWSYPSTLQVYHGVLSFTIHGKPKVRKEAHRTICSILRGSDFMFSDMAPPHHPAAQSTARFCIQQIEESGGSKEATSTLHVLSLLREVLPCFPISCVKSCCETLLRVMTMSHMVTCAMQVFHGLFSAKSNSSLLTAELNAQIITALYDYLPNEKDLQPMLAWLAVLEKAHINLFRLQSSLCLAHLPRLFSTAMNCLLSPHSQVLSAAAQAMKVLLRECVAPAAADIESIAPTSSICRMFRVVEEGLTYRFHGSWAFVLQLLGTFIQVVGKPAFPIVKQCLQSLCDLRSTAHFAYTGELDRTVGAAVESMGPEAVLQAIPLQIDGTERNFDFPRSWLIPVIRDHVKHTQLGFFNRYFLPLAGSLKSRAVELAQTGQSLEAKIYDTLQWQVWTLLPGFCTKPTDTASAFQGLARTLGSAISDRPDLRLPICQGLRGLIRSCETDVDRIEVSRFAKNFLPILFNVYSAEPVPGDGSSHRLPILETIRCYLSITEQQLVCRFTEKATEKLMSSESSEFTRLSVMDLVVAMAPYLDEPSMSTVYQTLRSFLQQKKAYRVLEELCGGQQEPCRHFVNKHLEDLKETLLGSLRCAASPAKRPRLKCLIHIVKQLAVEHQEFIIALIPEVIICMKEVSVGARRNGYTLLVEIGRAFLRFSDNEFALQQYLGLVYAGLTGSVTMISCTVLALTRLLFEFKGQMDTATVEQLLTSVCLLLQSRTRDVVKSAFSFIKVVIFMVDTSVLAQHLQLLMESIKTVQNDIRRHFRVKIKNIFTKLTRKFGFEMIDSLVPEEYHRVLVNIRKAEARNKRQRASAAVGRECRKLYGLTRCDSHSSINDILADTESDDEEAAQEREVWGARRQPNRAWLQEGQGDEPLNFLDPKVAQRVLATKPELNKNVKIKHNFKFTSDGRLIAGSGFSMHRRCWKLNNTECEESKRHSQESYLGANEGRGGKEVPKPDQGTGDVKLKGKPDPFAYLPLNKSQLNRRTKAKMRGRFRGLVKGAPSRRGLKNQKL